jgi:nucleoside-diphosphate-sugar epimerase
MRILVTGAGFIASHVVPLLKDLGHSVTLLDRRRPGGFPEDPWHAGCRFVEGDVCDRAQIAREVSEHDGVIHLAGLLGTSETIEDPLLSVRVNIEGTLNVLEACRPAQPNAPAPRAVVTTLGNHFMQNAYSITKSCAERFALMYNRELGTRAAVVRAFNAYGARQKRHPIRKLIPHCIAAALEGRPIEVFGTGEQQIDLVDARDVAVVLVRALTLPHDVYDSVIEAGTGRAVSVNEVARFVNETLGNRAGVRYLPMRPGEPEMSVVVADTSTLAPLGIDAADFTPWQHGLRGTMAWYRDHQVVSFES